MIRDMWEDGWRGKLMLLLFVLVAALIPLSIYAAVVDAQEWSTFKTVHNCRVTGKMRGDMVTTVAPIVGGNGGVAIGVSSTPNKTAWLRDDGVTYWR